MHNLRSSSLPRPPGTAKDRIVELPESMRWVRQRLAHQETLVSPLSSAGMLVQHADFLSPGTEAVANEALKKLLAFPSAARNMRQDDAERCLRYSVKTVQERAKKRDLEQAAEEEAEEAQRMCRGQRVRARRERISTRQPRDEGFEIGNDLRRVRW